MSRLLHSERLEDYHPFLTYMDTLPQWDGVDRVTPLAQRISKKAFWINGFHRWMLIDLATPLQMAVMMSCIAGGAMIFAIMIGATLFGFVLTILQVPQALTSLVAEMETSRWIVFIAIRQSYARF